jgi:outer membrane protein, heavy metal efflux system
MRPEVATTLMLALAVGTAPARAQGPTLPDPGGPMPPKSSTGPGESPGSGGQSQGPGANEALLGGLPGVSTPRVPSSITRPGGPFGPPPRRGLAAPPQERAAAVPLYGTLELPQGAEDEGPPDGLTLDQAIDRLVRCNLDLKARAFEIPQARADVLTAGLRANPILYVDGQLIPYGAFTRTRPGGQTQYDLNISHPIDLTGKRKARIRSASEAGKVLEAQYQDAVRIEVENLGTVFIDALAADDDVRQLRAGLQGIEEILEITRRLMTRGLMGPDEVDRVAIQRDSAAIGLEDAEESLRRSKRTLAQMLNLPPVGAGELPVRGTIRDTAPPPPPVDSLVELAIAARPDLAAYRLGVKRAEADVNLAKSERLSDVYLLYQPYTFQDNSPTGTKGAHSWALGLSVPMPVYNRNQGNIRRSTINVAQSRTELAAIERRVMTEVEQAERQYAVTRKAVIRIERDILPVAGRVRDGAVQLFSRGGSEVVAYLNARREYNDVVREYRDILVRHRRSMLALNAAVGLRILP